MDGILPLWKPKGLTSHDCVHKIRQLYGTKKVGHTGTLDPEVEGVLPICIGQATKIVPFLTETKKTYIAEVKLGISTDTEDCQGKIVQRKEFVKPPSKQQIENVLQSFTGIITQIPPMYSAVKINGKKLYEYARAGISVERPKRTVTIHEMKHLPSEKEADGLIQFEVTCSKGTYIRTLCVDIGNALGYPAHMSELVRTKTGTFSRENTVTLQRVEEAVQAGKQADLLLPITSGVSHLDKLYVDEQMKQKVLHGQKLEKPEQNLTTEPFAIMYKNTLLAIYQTHPDNSEVLKAVRVFNG